MNNILIINGHPDSESFCTALAQSYKEGALGGGSNCQLLNLTDLHFDPVLRYGYRKRTELEPDLLKAQEQIKLADHLVFIYPTWWGTPPALLKGFIDRTFLPGFAFKYKEDSIFWDKLLEGKTARLIVTMDAPHWYYKLIYRSPGHNAMKKMVLEFSGVKPVRITTLASVKTASEAKRSKWLKQVKQIGSKGN